VCRFTKGSICIGLVFILVVIAGCNREEEEILPLESDVVFKVYEAYSGSAYDYDSIGEPRIKLYMGTEKEYSAVQYTLLVDVEVKDSSVLIDIKGVDPPHGFISPLSEPAEYATLVDLANGEYRLFFTYEDLQDRYDLTVSDSFIEVTPEVYIITHPEFKEFWRYPEKSLVCYGGTVGEDIESDSLLFEGFIDTLNSNIELEEFEFPAHGEIPYPHSGQWQYDYGTWFFRYFRYEDETDYEAAGELLKDYTENLLTDCEYFWIIMRNWKNESCDSDDFRD
jgi:hypothetical protein